jgi:shikimate kinase
MGAGKTTIGRLLAESLHMDFVDSDHEIEQRTGASIPWIFDVEGEAGFRKRECSVINELTQRTNTVLATGGGAVLSTENRQALQARGTVIYLSASLEQLMKRTSRDKNRPLLQTENPQSKLEEILNIRDPLYREISDIVINTDKTDVRSSLKSIISALSK